MSVFGFGQESIWRGTSRPMVPRPLSRMSHGTISARDPAELKDTPVPNQQGINPIECDTQTMQTILYYTRRLISRLFERKPQ